jgi:hypothetical protein
MWAVALARVVSASAAPQAPVPDPENVAAGMRIFRTKGDCQSCHGWAADGRKMDSQMPDGANLRTTKLDRDKLMIAIKCGVPGKAMPAYDRLAYTDGRCYGMTLAALKKLGGLPDPPATLQPREIESVADFLFAKVVGKGPMDREKCIEYFGLEVEACKELK